MKQNLCSTKNPTYRIVLLLLINKVRFLKQRQLRQPALSHLTFGGIIFHKRLNVRAKRKLCNGKHNFAATVYGKKGARSSLGTGSLAFVILRDYKTQVFFSPASTPGFSSSHAATSRYSSRMSLSPVQSTCFAKLIGACLLCFRVICPVHAVSNNLFPRRLQLLLTCKRRKKQIFQIDPDKDN